MITPPPACSYEDTKVAIAGVSAILAVAGWASFFVQRKALITARTTLDRLQQQDANAWQERFIEYRRLHLKPFADGLRRAYSRFQPGAGASGMWEEAANAARWPGNLPLPDNERFQLWRQKYGVGLRAEDSLLLRFAEAIYCPYSMSDNRSPIEKSLINSDELAEFDKARGGVADYFDSCGYQRQRSFLFAKWLEDQVRGNHYQKVKMVAYLEIALVGSLGHANELGQGKLGLLELGRAWASDDIQR